MAKMTHRFESGMFVRHYQGREDQPLLLFIHGLGESGLCFEPLLSGSELASYTSLVPDLPGYGRSPWPSAEPASLTVTVDSLAVWLRAIGAGPVTVVGHSLGGVLATLLAERHPDRVAAVASVDGNISADDCTFSGKAVPWTRDDFVARGFDQLCDRIYAAGVGDSALRGYYVSLRLTDPRVFHAHAIELVEVSRAETLAKRLVGLATPSRYIAGVPDGVSARSRELLAAAGVDVADVSPSGHWPFLDQPAAFATALIELIGKRAG